MICFYFTLLGAFAGVVKGAAVFARFMVSNSVEYTVADWEHEIRLAQEARIDGFALNVAYGDAANTDSIPLAFTAAANVGGFRHIFSFDYAGNGSWPKSDVVDLIKTYGPQATYFKHEGTNKPLVSTIEGWKSATEWTTIKKETNCFFIPSFSSLGAKKAMETGVVDGLSSWAGWPTGPNSMLVVTDVSYGAVLGEKPYMMPVSPWFFTNMPGFRKNWLWRGDSLWFDRWTHVHFLKPEYVQIISWNDFGESHHIGPLPSRDSAYTAFTAKKGVSPFNYALGLPHDGWRIFLPFVIDRYKTGTSSITREGLSVWYRPHPAAACTTGGTTGNTASQLQTTFAPSSLAQDKVFFSALLTSAANVTVTIGGVPQTASWSVVPNGGIGIYHGNANFNGAVGTVIVTIARSSSVIASVMGRAITTTCTNGVQNWNAWVGSQTAANKIAAVSLPRTVSQQACIAGTGDLEYADLCNHACKNGYCPDSCTCTEMGKPPMPKRLGRHACPAAGRDSTFEGLCSFSADTGYLDTAACVERLVGTVCNAPLPATPAVPACVEGMGLGKYANLCAFTCQYNFCPPEVCSCTRVAASAPVAPQNIGAASYRDTTDEEDYGLCGWACNRGFCDRETCKNTEFAQILKSIGDIVDDNPIVAAMKLTAIEQQNSVYMVSYWSSCAAFPECGAGYTMVTTGHGKVFNAEKGNHVLKGCYGGGNGFNRALCVQSDVILNNCEWYGKPKNCGQTCPPNYMLLAHNTHIGGAKTGCKANRFSSYCCASIRPTRINHCPIPVWDRFFVGHAGAARAQNAMTERSSDELQVLGTSKECRGRTLGPFDPDQNRVALGALAGLPGFWISNSISGPQWLPVMNRPVTDAIHPACSAAEAPTYFTLNCPWGEGNSSRDARPSDDNTCQHGELR